MSTVSDVFMRRFVEFINTADEGLGNELISPDAKFYVPNRRDPMIGVPGYLDIIGMMRSGFPDIRWTLEETITENDKAQSSHVRIAARFIMRGTHQKDFNGVAASGKSIAVSAINFYRLSNGKIVEERGQPDVMTLMQQIGAIPAPDADTA